MSGWPNLAEIPAAFPVPPSRQTPSINVSGHQPYSYKLVEEIGQLCF